MAVIVSPQGWTGSWSNVTGTTGTFTGSGSYAGRTFSVYTPSGSNGTCYLPYAFDNNTTYGFGTIWQTGAITYFTITYDSQVRLESYELWTTSQTYIKTWYLQGSNDGSSYTTVDTGTYNVPCGGDSFTVDSPGYYKYYKFLVLTSSDNVWSTINELKLYGLLTDPFITYSHNASDITATQTSDTSPLQLLSGGTYSGYPMYNAFNHTNTSLWISSTGVPVWLGVDLGNAYVLTGCTLSIPTNYQAYAPSTFTIQGANLVDFTGAVTLSSQSSLTWNSNEMKTFSWSNSTAFRYFRVYVTACGGSYCYIGQIEIFGSFGYTTYTPNVNDITPNQTSDVSPLQLFSSGNYVGYLPYLSFNSNSTSGWLSSTTTMPVWLGIDLGRSFVMTSCTISPIAWSIDELYAPNTFSLQAAKRPDFLDYVTLSSQSNITWKFNEMKTFSWSNSSAYRYFRIYVTACGGSYCYIGQIEIFGSLSIPNKLNTIPHNTLIYKSNNEELIDISIRNRIGNYHNYIGA